VETFEITLQSVEPVDLGDLGTAGFDGVLKTAMPDAACNWEQGGDGRIRVVFRHEATDKERALGASERIASELGPGIWTAQVEEVPRNIA
jgi:hypothetical protein